MTALPSLSWTLSELTLELVKASRGCWDADIAAFNSMRYLECRAAADTASPSSRGVAKCSIGRAGSWYNGRSGCAGTVIRSMRSSQGSFSVSFPFPCMSSTGRNCRCRCGWLAPLCSPELKNENSRLGLGPCRCICCCCRCSSLQARRHA